MTLIYLSIYRLFLLFYLLFLFFSLLFLGWLSPAFYGVLRVLSFQCLSVLLCYCLIALGL